ncbi:MAG: hypothetical protein JWO73_15 [Candidatus Taylorbacteria bacterium]|nr:hypothetical protein [Candidatus Taylorbacteria bacterium]
METLKKTVSHQTAAVPVDVPTISIGEIGSDEDKRTAVRIQWFGRSDPSDKDFPDEAQFFFEPTLSTESKRWYGKPDAFKIVFIGPVRDWPKKEVAQQVADTVTEGNLDADVVWMVSSRFPENHPRNGDLIPSSMMTPAVILGDPLFGIIRPKPYCDMQVLEAELTEVRKKVDLAEQLLQNRDMELPPEAFPWNKSRTKCMTCWPLSQSTSQNPTIPVGGTRDDRTYICSGCHRRWWQYNAESHHWRNVTDKDEWDEVRKQSILLDAGFHE